jgi:hypothetical protein
MKTRKIDQYKEKAFKMEITELLDNFGKDWEFGEILEESNRSISITLGDRVLYHNAQNQIIMQKDYKVKGEIWQVHKSDADPLPSNPHAHCVGGRSNYVGTKLHLGTRQLFKGSRPLDLFLAEKPFMRLINLIKPKFPGVVLPILSI